MDNFDPHSIAMEFVQGAESFLKKWKPLHEERDGILSAIDVLVVRAGFGAGLHQRDDWIGPLIEDMAKITSAIYCQGVEDGYQFRKNEELLK